MFIFFEHAILAFLAAGKKGFNFLQWSRTAEKKEGITAVVSQ